MDIYAGCSTTEVLYDQDTNSIGVVTGDMARDRDGCKQGGFVSGIEIPAKQTMFAEGAGGRLAKALTKNLHVDSGKAHSSFAKGT